MNWTATIAELEHECCSGDRCEVATIEALHAIAEELETGNAVLLAMAARIMPDAFPAPSREPGLEPPPDDDSSIPR